MRSLRGLLAIGLLLVGTLVPNVWGAEWEVVQRRGYLKVGVKDNFPPLGFRDRAGDLTGFEIDIAKQLAKEILGTEKSVELLPVSNSDRFLALDNDQVDLVVAQVTLTNNRLRLVDFTLPYYTDGIAMVARVGTTTNQLNQPKTAIAVLKGSSAIATLQYFLPKSSLVGANSYQAGLEALQTGKVQAFAGDASAIALWVKANPEFVRVGELLSPHSLAIALPKGTQYNELRQKVYKVVEQWRQNGWLQARAKYWGL
jgi:polar amino acid transport system substrate-binding protein